MTEMTDLDSRTPTTMRQFLELEDAAPDDLLETLPGASVPFWAQVRMQIYWALSAQVTGSVDVGSPGTWTRWGELKRVTRGYLPSRWDAVRHAQAHDVCFYVSGVTLGVQERAARNWLVDDFAEATDGAVIVQTRPLPSVLGVPSFRPTLSMESAIARARWRARSHPLPSSYRREIDRLLVGFARHLDQPTDAFATIGRRAQITEHLRPFQLAEVNRMLERMQPRIVIFDNGSYTYHGETVAAFKNSGAYVVEPQHGWIGPSHAAYNYGRVFANPLLRRALPDEVLTFGDFWTTSIRHPGRVTTIGKPHLEKLAGTAPTLRPRRILVVSSRTEPEVTDAYVTALQEAIGDRWSVLFRPHPAERSETLRRYPRLSASPQVKVDLEPDVYESLKNTAVVIGEASTVLFEARAFGCEVIARESAFADNVIGDAFGARVEGVEQTVERITSLEDGREVIASSDPMIWAPDAVASYRRWLVDRRAELGPR